MSKRIYQQIERIKYGESYDHDATCDVCGRLGRNGEGLCRHCSAERNTPKAEPPSPLPQAGRPKARKQP